MIAGTLQVAGEGVVVPGRYGVELVVVAAGATHRQPEESFGINIDLVVHAVALVAPDVHRRVRGLTQVPKAGALRGLVPSRGRVDARVFHQVAGDVLDHKIGVRHVGVHGADDVVAVAIRLRNRIIRLVAARLGETHQVEPVLPPALAEVRRGQQPFDKIFVGVRRSTCNKRPNFLRCRRQADEVEVQPANERASRRPYAGGKFGSLQLGEDKPIDSSVGPVRAADRLDRWRLNIAPHRLPCPVFSFTLSDIECVFVRNVGRFAIAGIGRTHRNPLDQLVDRRLRELGFGRHL